MNSPCILPFLGCQSHFQQQNRKKTSKKPTFIDLFSGAGGLSLGFKQAGFKHLLGVEHDPKMAETYQKNIGKVLIKDIRKIKGKDLPEVDVIIGGPPCQGFSPANKKVWNERQRDPRQKFIQEFARIVEERRPKIFLMENSSALMNKRFKHHLDRFKRNLPHYDIECSIENLGEIGNIPQMRRRTICIGKKKG